MLLLVTADDGLAETLSERFVGWGIRSVRKHGIDAAAGLFGSTTVEVVLLDVRARGNETIERLKSIKREGLWPQVLLLNKADNIQVSIAGMRAGAADEITEPFCIETLKRKIIYAGHVSAKQRAAQPKKRRSLFAEFTAAMSAAAMAHGGEFDAALEMYNDYDKDDPKADKASENQQEDANG